MPRRHRKLPEQWLITDDRLGRDLLRTIARLPPGSGVILRNHQLGRRDRERLKARIRGIAARRGLTLVDEAEGEIARVHNAREIAIARLGGRRLLLLSPLYATLSHPDWLPLARMRAAAMIRLAGHPLFALGGMNRQRYRRVKLLGFDGWAGIDAFRT